MNMKTILASAASLTLLGGAACAQEVETGMEAETGVTAESETPVYDASVTADAEYVGKGVYDASGTQVGTIDEIVTAADGSEEAVVSVGTFLGLGAKKISVPTAELTASADGAGFTTTMTADEIESAPDYEADAATPQ